MAKAAAKIEQRDWLMPYYYRGRARAQRAGTRIGPQVWIELTAAFGITVGKALSAMGIEDMAQLNGLVCLCHEWARQQGYDGELGA